MSAQPLPETAEYLMKAVKEAGYSVSSQQVARWHRSGLLPLPRQQHLPWGKGTQTEYPPGTASQLVALVHLHRHNRYLDDVGWRLWWYGFDVTEGHWQGSLRHAAARFDGISAKTHWAVDLLDHDDDRIAKRALDELIVAATDSSAPRFVKHLRKRLGRDNFVSFLRFLMTVVEGTLGSPPDANTDRDGAKDLAIVHRATGLDLSQRRPPKGFPPLLIDPETIWESFGAVSTVIQGAPLVSRIATVSEGAWIEARDELRSLMCFFSVFVGAFRIIFRKRSPYGFAVAAEIADNATTFDLAGMLIFYRILKDEVFQGREADVIKAVRGFLVRFAPWYFAHAA